jgi:transcriptional regulator with GAF, ATPase, and Fis domain
MLSLDNILDELLEGRDEVIGYKTEKEEEREKTTVSKVNYIDNSRNEQIESHKELFNYRHKNRYEQEYLEVDYQDSLENTPPSNETRDQIIENALEVVYKKLNCQMVAIFLLSPKDGLLERVGVKGIDYHGNSINNSWFPEERYKIGESFTGKAASPAANSKYGKTNFSCDLNNEDLSYKDMYSSYLGDLKCAIASPLNGRNKTYGVLRVINKINDDSTIFNEIDLASISFFSGVISAAISNFHRDAQNEFLKFLKDSIIKSSNSNFDYKNYYKKVLKFSTGPETAFKACILRIKDDVSGAMEARDWSFVGGVGRQKNNDLRRLNQGFVGLAVQSRRPQIIERITKSKKIDKFINSKWINDSGIESFGCFPLIVHETEDVIGTISFFSGYEYEFHPSAINFLDDVISSIAVVVQKEKRLKKVEKRFSTLVNEWLAATKFLSSTTESVIHPAYQQIIGMGEAAIPLLLRELEQASGRWFWALRSITGEDPIPEEQRGKTEEMITAWINWGAEKGYIEKTDSNEQNQNTNK